MAHLTRIFLGIPPILQRQLKSGGFGHARKVRDWRGIMVKGLVYAASAEPAWERSNKVELLLVRVGNKVWNFGNILWCGNGTGKAYCR